ncbi:MAG: carbon-nitrogen family hydrolase [Desulfatibacillum sp.]|nr:carbon-nitrogen family hydrolase [Desulfatibacillum sp.]
MSQLKAGLIQFDVKLGDPANNLDHGEQSLRELASRGVKLALLPEMWSCGFDYTGLESHALDTPQILERLSDLAWELGLAISGALPEMAPEGIYNTHYFIDTLGKVRAGYRKVHRFIPAGEGVFAPGKQSVMVDTPWGKAGLLTCYDLRFPEQSRALVLAGATLLLVSAQWPEVRIAHWDVLLQARAVENQVFVLACNRCGQDPDLMYGGHSAIISPWGEILTRAGSGESLATATLNLNEVQDFRKRIPCLEHRSPEAYDLENIDAG